MEKKMSKKDKGLVPKIKSIRPCGQSVLVELLNVDEMLGTTLVVPESAQKGKLMEAPQAYVIALGPSFKPEEWGFNIGDRVMLTGSLTPAPRYDTDNPRAIGTVEPHFVKAVLEE
jgi:co-chaperonin GroES (HSP10)